MITSILAGLALSSSAAFCGSPVQEEAPKQWAVVELSSNFMREEPDYESGNGTQALMGTVVEVVDTDRYWKKIISPDPYTAWANELGLAMMDEAQKDEYIAAAKWICTVEYSHIYAEPDAGSMRISDFNMGDLVRKAGELPGGPDGSWYRVLLPSGRAGWVPASDIMDFRKWTRTRRLTAENILDLAVKFNGVPYMWGGNTVKYFDCSGLTRFVFFMNGVLIPRNASQQAFVGEEIPVDFDRMQPGDLLFFGQKATADKPLKASHVAIYMGNKRIIQASQVVRMNSLDPADPDFYDREIISVRRIIGHVDDGTGAISIKSSPWYFKQ